MPDHILKPPYVGTSILPEISGEFQVHDDEGIAFMRAACELAARVLEYAGTLVKVSVNSSLLRCFQTFFAGFFFFVYINYQ